jgi:L-lactate dehydrogenase complex protein LldG
MMTTRDTILEHVQTALKNSERMPMPALPALPRETGDTDARIGRTMEAIEYVSGKTRRVRSQVELQKALAELVDAEQIKKAMLWDNDELRELGIAEMLAELNVVIVSPLSDKHELAECDLGITSADAVLPQSGTLALRPLPGQSELVSLLPRVHLAIFRPAALCDDINQMLAKIKHDRQAVLITGPSRTADIEKTLAIGVHGPKMMYVWSYEG